MAHVDAHRTHSFAEGEVARHIPWVWTEISPDEALGHDAVLTSHGIRSGEARIMLALCGLEPIAAAI